MPEKKPQQRRSKQEQLLQLEHLREEYRPARQGLFGGLVTSAMAIIGLTVTAGMKLASLGGYYVWIVLIAACAIIVYFAFVFGRIARIKTKISKTQMELGMEAGANTRFTGSK
jgi:hypothetical protein